MNLYNRMFQVQGTLHILPTTSSCVSFILSTHSFPLPNPSQSCHFQPLTLKLKQAKRKTQRFVSSTTSYEVGGGYPEEESDGQGRNNGATHQQLDSSQREALLSGGEQVISVLQEIITLVSYFWPPTFHGLLLNSRKKNFFFGYQLMR